TRTFREEVGELPDEHGTTHILVRDGEGNVVSLTTTVNSAFGVGVEDESTGVLLNDELSDFTTTEQHRTWGLSGDPPNMFRPGARPVSSMTPTIVLWNSGTSIPECTRSEDGNGSACNDLVPSRAIAVAALGGSGGMRISTGVTQVARCLFSPFRSNAPADGRNDFRGFSDPQKCVDAPRFSVDWKGTLVRENLPSEPEATRKNIETAFAKMGVPLQPETFTTSAIHAIAFSVRDKSLGWFAAADKRKLGAGASK
ncbi:MAG: gamma-glutamyltransferase, partial [Polyangiaceae bacterium]|nr:gamma-glutamyltransferase [Polyangiaceae bacterium]